MKEEGKKLTYIQFSAVGETHKWVQFYCIITLLILIKLQLSKSESLFH